MENRQQSAKEHEQACTRVAALFTRRWLRRYVASKLRSDPVFPAAWNLLGTTREPLLDLGCGIGLLPFYLRERGFEQRIVAVDVDKRKLAEGREAARTRYRDIEFIEHDLAHQIAAFRGNVAMLDLLHYLPPARQRTLLAELAACVPAGGALLLRDSPRDGSPRFWITYAGEVFAQSISWNMNARLHFPSLDTIHASFRKEEFARDQRPAWGATPFNNRLFVFQRHAYAIVPSAEGRNDTRAQRDVAA
jgi:SAM-dependent methyltransferase